MAAFKWYVEITYVNGLGSAKPFHSKTKAIQFANLTLATAYEKLKHNDSYDIDCVEVKPFDWRK